MHTPLPPFNIYIQISCALCRYTEKEKAAGSYQLPDMSEGAWNVYVLRTSAGMLQGELLGPNALSSFSQRNDSDQE